MSKFTSDLFKISIFLAIWLYFYNTTAGSLKIALFNVPLHSIVTLGYYAILKISFNIMNISKLLFYF